MGRRIGRRKRDTVDGYRSIDVRRFHREGMLKPGWRGFWQWRDRDGKPEASIRVSADADAVWLTYAATVDDKGTQVRRYPVALGWTACNYGGRRPWFLCPGRDCSKRVAKLYAAGAAFLCRHCYGLVYEIQREGEGERLLRKAQKIRVRLGGSANTLVPFPWRPKGIHWRTYWQLRGESERALMGSLSEMMRPFR